MRRLVSGPVRSVFRSFGYDIVSHVPAPDDERVRDFEPEEREIYQQVAPYTLTGPDRVVSLIRALNYLERNRILGDIVECGVWKGGSMMAAALTLLRQNCRDRRLWLFDTFQGMSEPTERDLSTAGHSAQQDFEADWLRISMDDVRAAVLRTGYPAEHVFFVKGKVEDTVPAQAPAQIALLRLDTDWYESTRHELEHLFPRLVRGGVLIIDDYGHWEGARQATDEYFTNNKTCILLNRIDWSARIAVKL
jgi:O-methyltransferase